MFALRLGARARRSGQRLSLSKGVWGTPPRKPLKCKSGIERLGAIGCSCWADPTGGTPKHSCLSSAALRLGTDAIIGVVRSDIIKTSRFYRSQTVFPFVDVLLLLFRATKNPAYARQAGYGNPRSILYLLTSSSPRFSPGLGSGLDLDSPGRRIEPWFSRL